MDEFRGRLRWEIKAHTDRKEQSMRGTISAILWLAGVVTEEAAGNCIPQPRFVAGVGLGLYPAWSMRSCEGWREMLEGP